MWPFNRNKNESNVAPEIEELYRAERRERLGVAWLLGLGTLVVTVLLAAGLFFGGRWIWNRLGKVGEPKEQANTQSDSNNSSQQSNPTPAPSSANPATPAPSTPTPAPAATSTPAPTTPPTPPAATPTPAPAATPTPAPVASSSSTAAKATNSSLPSTGPGDTVAIFAGVAVVAGGVHYAATTKRRNSND